jgi:uncharacterized membrane protein
MLLLYPPRRSPPAPALSAAFRLSAGSNGSVNVKLALEKTALYCCNNIIMKKNVELRAVARKQLRGGWLSAIVMLPVYSIIIGASGFFIVGPLILTGPLTLGFMGYYLKKARGESVKLENLFDGFKMFGSSFLLFLLETIFIALWACLLIIPGIVKSFSYSMAFYILRDDPEIGAAEAITRSRKMMDGYKGKLFGLYISFIGWGLLCVLSFGIGFLWLCPYISLSVANFYEDLKQNLPVNGSNPVVRE